MSPPLPWESFPKTRLQRLRSKASLRGLVQETFINLDKLILPLFIKYGSDLKAPILSMPGHFQISIDHLEEEVTSIWDLGIKAVILFGIPQTKDPMGMDSYSSQGIIQTAIPIIKKAAPNLLVISDICLCEYTNHGHCGVIHGNCAKDLRLDNDATLDLLARQAVSHAKAGTDIIAPSANMDGMVGAIRAALDAAGYSFLPILSYAVKYASSLYSPFREAAHGAPTFGDRRTYQMDFSNADEALRECSLDVEEGADILMVKPAHTYLDIIYKVKRTFPGLPIAGYHTSGEFAFIKAAAMQGWVDEKKAVFEVLTAIHRAGACFIISYYTKEVARWLKEL